MAETKLKQYFPLLRTREEVLEEIHTKQPLKEIFDHWPEECQNEFLDFCTGVRGGKMVYDSFFKEVMNPESTPERLEELLSLILEQKIKILMALPNDSTRIADETSLLATDIVVEHTDGSIADVEIQKIGYAFSGERSACYSADLLLRQYKRVRGKKGKKFHYRDIRRVYTIVLFEQSPKAFHAYPESILHHFTQKSNTGLDMELLQEYIFLPLDIFRNIYHNRGIQTKLEAWLAFFSLEEPEAIVDIMASYPDFKPMYEQVYDICRNTEKIMGIFSRELIEMDRNAVQYMMDEMQAELDQKKRELNQMNQELTQMNQELTQTNQKLAQTNQELTQKNQALSQKDQELSQKDQELSQKDQELSQKEYLLQEALRKIKELENKI